MSVATLVNKHFLELMLETVAKNKTVRQKEATQLTIESMSFNSFQTIIRNKRENSLQHIFNLYSFYRLWFRDKSILIGC